ncbi:unnamed protein product [Camellia sinensis]
MDAMRAEMKALHEEQQRDHEELMRDREEGKRDHEEMMREREELMKQAEDRKSSGGTSTIQSFEQHGLTAYKPLAALRWSFYYLMVFAVEFWIRLFFLSMEDIGFCLRITIICTDNYLCGTDYFFCVVQFTFFTWYKLLSTRRGTYYLLP